MVNDGDAKTPRLSQLLCVHVSHQHPSDFVAVALGEKVESEGCPDCHSCQSLDDKVNTRYPVARPGKWHVGLREPKSISAKRH